MYSGHNPVVTKVLMFCTGLTISLVALLLPVPTSNEGMGGMTKHMTLDVGAGAAMPGEQVENPVDTEKEPMDEDGGLVCPPCPECE